MVQIHHTPAWRSTSVGRWRGRQGWSHRSIRSTSFQGERWSWSWLLMVQELWFPSAFCQQYRGTWWCHQIGQCWRTGPYGCRRRTSWWSCILFHGYRKIPYPGRKAGTELLGNGISRYRWWWPDHQAIHRTSRVMLRQRRWPFPVQSPERRSTISPWCHGRFLAQL